MTIEDQEYNDFMKEATLKAIELRHKYDKFSDNNKRRFLEYIEPIVRASGIQGFINQVNLLFSVK